MFLKSKRRFSFDADLLLLPADLLLLPADLLEAAGLLRAVIDFLDVGVGAREFGDEGMIFSRTGRREARDGIASTHRRFLPRRAAGLRVANASKI